MLEDLILSEDWLDGYTTGVEITRLRHANCCVKPEKSRKSHERYGTFFLKEDGKYVRELTRQEALIRYQTERIVWFCSDEIDVVNRIRHSLTQDHEN